MDIYILLVALAFPHRYEAFVFTSTPNATTTVCEGETVPLDWTYTSGTPNSIVWTKRNNDATNSLNASVASFSIGSFIQDPAYGTRVTQGGNNAAIQLSGVTPADDGIYQVEIADLSDSLIGKTTLRTFESPVGTITVSYLGDTSPVKCEGLSSLGSGNLSLVLDGNTVKSTQSLSLEFTPSGGGRCCCCVTVSSDFEKCLPAGESFTNCSAHCVDLEDITSTTSATPGSTTDKKLYYLFILILIPVCIIICVVVVKRRRKKKEKDSNSADLKDLAGINSRQSTKYANDEPGRRL